MEKAARDTTRPPRRIPAAARRRKSGEDDLAALKKHNERLALARSVVYTIGTVGAAVIVSALIFTGLLRPTVVIEPITVPKSLAERGYTSETVSRQLANLVRNIHEEARTEKRLSRLTEPEPDVQVPGLGLSLHTIRRYINELFGVVDVRIAGALTCAPTTTANVTAQKTETGRTPEAACDAKDLRLVLHTESGSITSRDGLENDSGNVNELLKRGSEAIVRFTDPYALASYAFQNESKLCEIGDCSFKQTIAHIDYCLKRKPEDDDQWALNLRGHLFRTLQQHEDAIATYKQAMTLDSTFALTYYSLANASRELGRRKDAIRNYALAAAAKSDSVRKEEIYNNWGTTLLDEKEPKQALEMFRAAVDANSKFADGHFNAGLALEMLKRDGEAIKAFQKAIKLNPKYVKAYNNLGNVFFRKGRYEEAAQKYEEALRFEPLNEQTLHNQSLALSKVKEKREPPKGSRLRPM